MNIQKTILILFTIFVFLSLGIFGTIFYTKHLLTKKLSCLEEQGGIELLFENIEFSKLEFSTSSLATIVFKADGLIIYPRKDIKNSIGKYIFYWHLNKREILFSEYRELNHLSWQKNFSNSIIDNMIRNKLQKQ